MRNDSGMRMIADTNAEIFASLGLWADKRREYMSGPTRYAEPTTNNIEMTSQLPIFSDVGKL